MRLTLRTLLAYLDDILDPAQAREIGEKVDESEFARLTVGRIRDVVRRRRLTAPDVSGPKMGVDPNIVAEYLDNHLSPKDVSDVERVCLNSDTHLAEVAASHQILTRVLGEPVEVVPDSRDRMYALGPIAEETEAHVQPAARPAPIGAQKPEASGTFAAVSGIPDQPRWQRTLPYLLVVLLTAAWIGLIVGDDALFQPDSFAVFSGIGSDDEIVMELGKDTSGDSKPIAPAPVVPAVPAPSAPELAGEPEAPIVANAEALPAPAGDRLADTDVLEPAPDASVAAVPIGETKTSDTAANETTTNESAGTEPSELSPVPAPQATEIASLPPEKAADDLTSTPPTSAEVGDSTEPLDATPEDAVASESLIPGLNPSGPVPTPLRQESGNGVLLAFNTLVRDWDRLDSEETVRPRKPVAVPAPFSVTVRPEALPCRMRIPGGTLWQYFGANKFASWGVLVESGRLVIETEADEFAGDDGFVMALAAPQQLYGLEVLEPESVCGIEVLQLQPTDFEAMPEQAWLGRFYVAKGRVRVSDDDGHVAVVAAGTSIELPLTADAAADEGETLPGWVTIDAPSLPSATRRYASLFAEELIDGEAVSDVIGPLTRDRRPRVAEIAIECLSTIGQHDTLVEGLARSEHEEVRLAAIDGLRNWLTRDRENGSRLKRSLDQIFHDARADAAYRMLWGYSSPDATDPDLSAQLVEWLADDELAIRELAFYHVSRMTGRTHDYRPSLTTVQRNRALARWRRHIEREGALVPRAPEEVEFDESL